MKHIVWRNAHNDRDRERKATTVVLWVLCLLLLNVTTVASFNGVPEDYESWTAEEKYNFWSNALTEEAAENAGKSLTEQSGDFPGPLGKLRFLTTDDFSPTFERFRDDLPYTHAKRIRSVGGVGMVAWHPSTTSATTTTTTTTTTTNESPNNSYTGFFATGTPHALIRLSYTSPNDASGTTPGLSLKLFRDGIPSSNILAMESLEGQASGNFFEFDFSNHLAPAKTALLKYVGRRFSRYSCPSTRTGLSEIAVSTEIINSMVDATAADSTTVIEEANNVEFPYRIIFRPNPDLTDRFASYSPEQSLFDTLSAIEVGTKLYDIYAVSAPDLDGTEIETHVGHLELTQALQPSVLGDNVLFFRHQKIEEDYAMRPQYNIPDEGAPRCPFGH